MSKSKQTLQEFLDEVGRPRFQHGIGRSVQLITRAKDEGLMPASWYIDVRDWCVANNIVVPEHLFKWNKVSDPVGHSKQNVYSARSGQGEQR